MKVPYYYSTNCLLTVKQFSEKYAKKLKVAKSTISTWVARREKNGLCKILRQVGTTIVIEEGLMLRWIKKNTLYLSGR